MIKKMSFFLLFALVFFQPGVFAQEVGDQTPSLKVLVLNASGSSLEGILVTMQDLHPQSGGAERSVTTNDKGIALFTKEAFRDFKIEVKDFDEATQVATYEGQDLEFGSKFRVKIIVSPPGMMSVEEELRIPADESVIYSMKATE